MVEAVKYFKYFVEGRPFAIFTDHMPLVTGFKKKTTPLSPMQHFAFLSTYTSDIRHIAGEDNVLPDLLSRTVFALSSTIDLPQMPL